MNKGVCMTFLRARACADLCGQQVFYCISVLLFGRYSLQLDNNIRYFSLFNIFSR